MKQYNVISSILNKISSKTLLKNISYLFGGQMLAQLISLVGAFFIPRILGPESYGEYQVIISYVLMYKLLTFTGVNKVNIRDIAKDVNKVSLIINNSLFFRIVFAILGVIICLIVLYFINYTDSIKLGVVVFSAFLILFSIENTVTTVFYSLQKLEFISYLNIAKSLIQVSASVLALLMGYGVMSLVVIYLVTELLIVILGFYFVLKHTDFKPKLNFYFDKDLFKRAYKFSLIDFFNILSSKVDIVMLSFLSDPIGVGVYSLANLLARKGLIVRRAISQSIFPYYSEKNKEKLTFKLLNRHLLLIVIPSLVVIFIIFISSDFIIELIAGPEYLESSKILKILVFYLAFHYAVIPFASALESQNMERFTMYIGLVRAIANVSLNFIFFKLFGIIGIAYSTLVTWFINFVIHYIITYRQFSLK